MCLHHAVHMTPCHVHHTPGVHDKILHDKIHDRNDTNPAFQQLILDYVLFLGSRSPAQIFKFLLKSILGVFFNVVVKCEFFLIKLTG